MANIEADVAAKMQSNNENEDDDVIDDEQDLVEPFRESKLAAPMADVP